MAESKLVLVTGATGTQGGAVVEALLTRGHRVRALTRNTASPAANRLREQGVEIAVGDFTDHGALVRAARGADRTLIASASLFDVYQGDRLPAGKKSLAIEVTFQPRERTLTDAEIETASQKVVAAVTKATGAALR